MIPVDYGLGKKIVETCTCECGAVLSLPWGGAFGIESYVIKCPVDPSHDRVTPLKSFYQMWKDGEELPSFIQDNIERKQRRKIMEQNDVKAMVVKQDADKLSTYVKARFPQDLVSPQVALDFAKWCIAHQLEPIRDCIPYHGSPYITVEWLDRQASGDKKFKGYSYKVFGQQDKEALEFDPKDLVVECQGDWDGLKKPLVGLGVVTKVEREARTGGEVDEVTAKGYRSPVVHAKPQQILFKRARAATLKQRYHIPAPILEELPYTTVVETEYRIVPNSLPPSKPEGGEETTEPAGKKVSAAAPTKSKPEQNNWRGFWAQVKELGLSEDRVHEMLGVTSVKEWTDQGKTLDEAIEVVSKKFGQQEATRLSGLAGEDFTINPDWLRESQKTLKWSDDALLTFIISQYKVSGKTVTGALNNLTREQAEDFTKQINSRVEKQPSLFESG